MHCWYTVTAFEFNVDFGEGYRLRGNLNLSIEETYPLRLSMINSLIAVVAMMSMSSATRLPKHNARHRVREAGNLDRHAVHSTLTWVTCSPVWISNSAMPKIIRIPGRPNSSQQTLQTIMGFALGLTTPLLGFRSRSYDSYLLRCSC